MNDSVNYSYALYWDWVVRVFHLTIALVFFSNFFLNEAGEDWHEYLGYLAVLWLVLRMLWGGVGSQSANWRYFFPNPKLILQHLKALMSNRTASYIGHSPLGGLVMLIMMLLILALGVTGFMMEEIDVYWGEDWLMDLHHQLANILCGFVVLHILAAIFQSIKTRENLPLSMLTGKRRQFKKL